MGDPFSIAALAAATTVGASAAGGAFRKPRRIHMPPTVRAPEIVSEQVEADAIRAARRRRGLGSTLLTGETGPNAMNIGKKQLLGS